MLNNKGEEVGIIYGWYNTLKDMWYVGQTIHPEGRLKRHIDRAINKKYNTYFYNSIRKYGLDKFVYCVLEDNVLRANLSMKEMDWIEEMDSFENGYNMTLGGEGSLSRTPWNKGKIGIFSKESRKRMSESHKGKHLSEKTRLKMSESHKGILPWNTGKPSLKRKKVSKYDLNGNYIQTYNSILEAKSQNPKAGHLNDVCQGLRKQAGGFIWKYAS